MDLVWHRNDLRISDNTALSEADEARPVFVFDERLLKESSVRRTDWLRRNILSLKQEYRSRGSDLMVRKGDPTDIIPELAKEADRVLWNKSYSRIGRKRDELVKEKLDNVKTYHDRNIHHPEEIFTNKGESYSVFTYYYKKWKRKDKREKVETSDEQLLKFDDNKEVPKLQKADIDLPEPGTQAAVEKLGEFLEKDVHEYEEKRDYPSEQKTSGLSPYMSYGVISPREVFHKSKDFESFVEQLAWRDFYTQVLYHNPEVVQNNYKSYNVEWRKDEEDLEKWKKGKTGYPIVDAGMRQLLKEGVMHNRLRMIVASFLTKDLMIDWREGYEWFRKMLIDHDTANDNGGWQWAASTGTDAQPYFRIFNPMKQGERYDPNAEYIKEYVPELEDLEADKIHNWTEIDNPLKEAPDYVEPIVNHSERREQAIEMFEEAREE